MKSNIENIFTDTVDIDFRVSFFEYGIARNPKNNFVIYSLLGATEETINNYSYDYTIVRIEEIIVAINDIEQGFFDYIGQEKEACLKELSNNYLSYWILSLNSYNGIFNDSCTWNYSLKDILNINKVRC